MNPCATTNMTEFSTSRSRVKVHGRQRSAAIAVAGLLLLALGVSQDPAGATQTEEHSRKIENVGTKIAFQATNNRLMVIDAIGEVTVYGKMRPGTSPSLAMFPKQLGGGIGADYRVAYQDQNGRLATVNQDGGSHLYGLTVSPGTSPSLAVLPGGNQLIAFRCGGMGCPSGHVEVVRPDGGYRDLGTSAPNTSPSMVGFPDGSWWVAFQCANGDLCVGTEAGPSDWGAPMMPGTSPSIAGYPDGLFDIALQDSTGHLTVIGPRDWVSYPQPMVAGSSPSITAFPNDEYRVGFQSTQPRGKSDRHGVHDGITTDYDLWVVGPSYSVHDWLGMMPGSSPSISSKGSHYEGAYQANNGALWVMDEVNSIGSHRKVATGTSPSIGVW